MFIQTFNGCIKRSPQKLLHIDRSWRKVTKRSFVEYLDCRRNATLCPESTSTVYATLFMQFVLWHRNNNEAMYFGGMSSAFRILRFRCNSPTMVVHFGITMILRTIWEIEVHIRIVFGFLMEMLFAFFCST